MAHSKNFAVKKKALQKPSGKKSTQVTVPRPSAAMQAALDAVAAMEPTVKRNRVKH